MQHDAFLFRAVVFAIVCAVVHLVFEIFSARTPPLRRLPISKMLPPVAERATDDDGGGGASRKNSHRKRRRAATVAVTGGAGFLGTAIVRRLQKAHGFRVVVVDRMQPCPSRRVAGVTYHSIDITTGPLRPLVDVFRSCDAVCHSAGVVTLTDDYGIVHNAHVVATQRIIRAARLAGVRALVSTSSSGAVTSPYVPEAYQQKLRSDFRLPTDWQFFSHYSRTKYEAEQLVLQSNCEGGAGDDGAGRRGGVFRTLALRMPGIYGVGDTLMVDAITSGLMTFMPGGGKVRRVPIDFCYVHNAALAHALALEQLLAGAPGVAGRTYNVTNGDEPQDALDMWNGFIARLSAARARAGGKPLQPLFRMPYLICLALACTSEFLFWFLAGRVPFRRHAFWNFTRASLDIVQVSITLDIGDTRETLGYKPLFTTAESMNHIVAQLTSRQPSPAEEAGEDVHRSRTTSSPSPAAAGRTPRAATAATSTPTVVVAGARIDWRPRALSGGNAAARAFGTLSGPGSSLAELTVTAAAAVLSALAAHTQASGANWSTAQLTVAVAFAVMNGAAAVQCMTPTSKRWYHARGRLSAKLLLFMVAEVAAQVSVLGYLFSPSVAAGGVSEAVAAAAQYAARVAGPLGVAMLIVHTADLGVQRAVGVLLFMGLVCWFVLAEQDAIEPRMRWAAPLLCLKYLVSHVPRHEPYE